jgi:hypothetical protein
MPKRKLSAEFYAVMDLLEDSEFSLEECKRLKEEISGLCWLKKRQIQNDKYISNVTTFLQSATPRSILEEYSKNIGFSVVPAKKKKKKQSEDGFPEDQDALENEIQSLLLGLSFETISFAKFAAVESYFQMLCSYQNGKHTIGLIFRVKENQTKHMTVQVEPEKKSFRGILPLKGFLNLKHMNDNLFFSFWNQLCEAAYGIETWDYSWDKNSNKV